MAAKRGFKYRKSKFHSTHAILGYLYKNQTVSTILCGRLVNKKYNKVSLMEFAKISGNPHHDWDLFIDSCRILKRDNFVEYEEDKEDFQNGTISLNEDGEEAFKNSFYIIKRRKDNYRRWKLAIRWVIPFITFGFSLSALIISIYAESHQKSQEIKITPQTIVIKDTQQIINKKTDSLTGIPIQAKKQIRHK